MLVGHRTSRREFIAGLGSAAAWPLVARAQQSEQVRRVGFVMAGAENDPAQAQQAFAFREGMRKLGWLEGKNLVLEARWQAGGPERAQAVISELINLPVDIILVGTIPAFLALRRSSSNIPVVFVNLPDPVATGLVSTIAKTNSNFTAFTSYEYSITGKWLQVLKEITPDVNRVGFIFGTTMAPVGDNFYRSLETVAPSFEVTTIPIRFSDASALDTELKAFGSEPKAGLLIAAEGATYVHRAKIISFATDHRLPAVYPFRPVVAEEGGLACYGIDFVDHFARAPAYVDQILHGANPASLPIQAPTKFELVINLKAAKAIGLTVPPTVLARADERAQQQAKPVIGWLSITTPSATPALPSFLKGLAELEFVEGSNVDFEYRWAEFHPERFPPLAADLVQKEMSVIAAVSGEPAVRAAKSATTKIPIIFLMADDPVRLGLVESLNRPGGNLTGVAAVTAPVVMKQIELMNEVFPGSAPIDLLIDPTEAADIENAVHIAEKSSIGT